MTTNTPRTSLDGFHTSETAQRSDELARTFISAISAQDVTSIDRVLGRNFQSYGRDRLRSRTGLKQYFGDLHQSFSDLSFEVHENVGVLVENDLVALRTIITGTHTGDYLGVAATGKTIQTSVSHILRIRDDHIIEHWPVMDTYRILVKIGAIPGVGANFQQLLGVPAAEDGIFVERLGTPFDAPRTGRTISRDESRAVGRRLYDGAITTGIATDVDTLADTYRQNTGWTPDGSDYLARHGRSAGAPCPMGSPCRPTSWPRMIESLPSLFGTALSPRAARPSTSPRLTSSVSKNGLAAEHWDTVDYVRLYESFGLLPPGQF